MRLIELSKCRWSFAYCFLHALAKLFNLGMYEILKLNTMNQEMYQVTFYLYWTIGLLDYFFLYSFTILAKKNISQGFILNQ